MDQVDVVLKLSSATDVMPFQIQSQRYILVIVDTNI